MDGTKNNLKQCTLYKSTSIISIEAMNLNAFMPGRQPWCCGPVPYIIIPSGMFYRGILFYHVSHRTTTKGRCFRFLGVLGFNASATARVISRR